MLTGDETVLVAVSGGVDSVALLDVLGRLAPEYGLSLHVAHLDHGLRAEASAEDARFVAQLAARLGMPLHAERLPPGALAAARGHGTEGAAREARYAFLERQAAGIGAHRIALGHTASDQAETILHRLVRGAGIAGLRGIPPIRGPFIRPLLGLTRSEILAYAETRRLMWRDDATNADPAFARNRIRHRVLPELEQINPRAVEAICRASGHAAGAEDIATFLVSNLWNGVCSEQRSQRVVFRRNVLSCYPPGVRRLLLREGVRRARGTLRGIDEGHVLSLQHLLAASLRQRLDLPGLHAQAAGNELVLSREEQPSVGPWAFPVELGRTEIPDPPITLTLSVHEAGRPPLRPSDRWDEVADADRIAFPLSLRSRHAGDRFAPLGLGTETKLKDFLVNARLPDPDRGRIPLLCDQEKIVWVVGVRLSEAVRLGEDTRRYLTMQARWRR